MQNEKNITVIINVYNGAKYIKRCLGSIFAQTICVYKILLVDNCSDDQLADSFYSCSVPADIQVVIIRTTHLMPLYEARNFALKYVSTEYISFCDVDDYWLPTKLEHQLLSLTKEKTDIVFSNFLHEIESENSLNRVVHHFIPSSLHAWSHFFKPYVHFSSLIGKTVAIKDILFDDRLTILGDADFLFRFTKKYKLSVCQSFDTLYTYHKNNTGATRYLEIVDELKILASKYYSNDIQLSLALDAYSKYIGNRLIGRSIFVSIFMSGLYQILKIGLIKKVLM